MTCFRPNVIYEQMSWDIKTHLMVSFQKTLSKRFLLQYLTSCYWLTSYYDVLLIDISGNKTRAKFVEIRLQLDSSILFCVLICDVKCIQVFFLICVFPFFINRSLLKSSTIYCILVFFIIGFVLLIINLCLRQFFKTNHDIFINKPGLFLFIINVAS